MGVDRHRQRFGVVPGLGRRTPVQRDERRKALGLAADDGQRERQAEPARAHHRLRRAAGRDPDRQRVLHGPRPHARILQRSPQASRPGDAFARADLQQQVELLGVEVVVVVQVVAEQREGLDEGAAAGHDLGPAARDEVKLGELLKDAHGIVGAEHGDRAGEPDPLGPRGDRGQGDGRGGDEEVGPVVLTDGEHVEAELVGQHALLDQVLHPLLRADARGEVGEGGDSEFHANQNSNYLRAQLTRARGSAARESPASS